MWLAGLTMRHPGGASGTGTGARHRDGRAAPGERNAKDCSDELLRRRH
jgi:hypothetical protein